MYGQEKQPKQLDFRKLGLYGRDRETKALNNAFQNILSEKHTTKQPEQTQQDQTLLKGNSRREVSDCGGINGVSSLPKTRTQVVWIEGVSGSGKSALANQLKQSAEDAKCFYATGKYDTPQQNQDSQSGNQHKISNQLYQGIRLALGNLCEQILTLPRRSEEKQNSQENFDATVCDNSVMDSTAATSHINSKNSNEDDNAVSYQVGATNVHEATTTRNCSSFQGNGSEDIKCRKLFFEDVQALILLELKESFDVLDLLIPNLPKVRDNTDEGNTKLTTASLSNGEVHIISGATELSKYERQSLPQQNFKEVADRMKYECRRFIEIVSRHVAPTVIVLDDLQWADQASLDLLLHWITDSNMGALMIVGIYRSEETVASYHPLRKIIAKVEGHQRTENCPAVVKSITLRHLGISEVEDLLGTLFDNAALGSTLDLADIVLEKSGGNSFYVVKFIQLLEKKNLLRYDDNQKLWVWDTEDILTQTAATVSLDVLMKDLLLRCGVARILLPVAACLGSTFSTSILFRVYRHLIGANPDFVRTLLGDEQESQDTSAVLTADENYMDHLLLCLSQEGFLEKLNAKTYCFIHDLVQEAAINLLPEKKMVDLEFQVGEAIQSSCHSEKERNEMVFSILSNLNPKAVALKSSDPKRIKISILNETAAAQAMKSSSFETASWHYRRALSLLPTDRWSDRLYDRTLALYISAAIAEAGKGDESSMLSYANAVQEHGKNIYDKLPLYHMMMDWFFARKEPKKSTDIGKRVLHELGYRLPNNELMLSGSMIFGLLKSKSVVSKYIDFDFEKMPKAMGRREKAIILTMDKLATSAYFVNEKLLALSIFNSLRMIFDVGFTDNASSVLALYGFIVTNTLNDYILGKKCGERALQLVDKAKDKRWAARVTFLTYGMSFHRMDPFKSSSSPLYEGIQQGINVGDFESASVCAILFLQVAFECGRSLATIESNSAEFTKFCEDFAGGSVAINVRGFWQMVLSLMGTSTVLTGLTIVDVDQIEADWQAKGMKRNSAPLRMQQMIKALYFGDHEFGANMALDIGDFIQKETQGQPSTMAAGFANALSCYHMVQSNSHNMCVDFSKRKRYLSYAKKAHRNIHNLLKKGNPNCRHYAALLDAESCIINEESQITIVGYYQEALAFAFKNDLLHIQALVLERYALFWKQQGNKKEFDKQAMSALHLYQKWGAHGIVSRLSQEWGPDLGELLNGLPEKDNAMLQANENRAIPTSTEA